MLITTLKGKIIKKKNSISARLVIPNCKKPKNSGSSTTSKYTKDETFSEFDSGDDMSVVSSRDGATSEAINEIIDENTQEKPLEIENNATEEVKVDKSKEKRRNIFPLNSLWSRKFRTLLNLLNKLQVNAILT